MYRVRFEIGRDKWRNVIRGEKLNPIMEMAAELAKKEYKVQVFDIRYSRVVKEWVYGISGSFEPVRYDCYDETGPYSLFPKTICDECKYADMPNSCAGGSCGGQID